jgi:hypothetical protein
VFTVTKINGVALSGLSTGILKNTTGTGVPSIAVAADFPTLNQNTTGSAATLTTTRNIAMTGDVAWNVNFNGSASVTAAGTIQAGAVTLAKMANLAANSLIGNNTGAGAVPVALTFTQVTAALDVFTSTLQGVVPASGGGTTNFLRADGTWAAPPGGGSGSITTSGYTMNTARFLGRTTAAVGAVEELTAASMKTALAIAASDVSGLAYFATGTDAANLTGTVAAARTPAYTGDVTKPAGSGVTTIANDSVTYAKMQNVSATARILGRKTAGAGDPEECTLSEILDFIGSAAQGDILYRGSTGWAKLAAGTSGQFLKTQGAGANPVWAAAAGSSDPWTYIKLAADGAGTAATLESTGLTVAGSSFLANTNYEFEVIGSIKGTTAFRVAMVWPGGVTGTAAVRVVAGATEIVAAGDQSATLGDAVNINSSSYAALQVKGQFYTGGSAGSGSLDIQFRNTSGSGTHTIMKGSFLRYRSIP